MFTPDDPYAGVDLDHCRDDASGEIEPWARDEIALLASYTEESPSGTGVHAILRAMLPVRGKTGSGRDSTGRKKGPREVYDRDRFFTMTGRHIEGTPVSVEERQAQLEQWCVTAFPDKPTPPKKPPPRLTPATLRPDDVVIAKARSALNGAKFVDLFAGRWEGQGYPSQSEADMALVGILHYWTQDAEQIDRIFRASGLYRPERWDRLGESTIAKVVNGGAKSTPGLRRRTRSSPRPSPISGMLSGSGISTGRGYGIAFPWRGGLSGAGRSGSRTPAP